MLDRDNYTYKELVDLFSSINLIGLKEYDIGKLLCDPIYIQSRISKEITMQRIIIRFFSLCFKRIYKVYNKKVNKEKSIYFLFTGDSCSRKDYFEDFNNVTGLAENKRVIFVNYKKATLSFKNIFKLPILLFWLYQLRIFKIKPIQKIDLMISLFRSISERDNVLKLIDINDCKLFVSFCDQWLIDSAVVQFLNKKDIPTATLQHGTGDVFFYGSSSKYFLCNSEYVRQKALSYGMKKDLVISTGFMKLISKEHKKSVVHINNGYFGVVLDGDIVFDSNIELLMIANQLSNSYNLKFLVRFHPSSDKSKYNSYLDKNNIHSLDKGQSLEEFLKNSDFVIVCFSTLFLEITKMLKPIFRYIRDTNSDYYKGITWNSFSNINECKNLYNLYMFKKDVYDAKLINCCESIFGTGDIATNYQQFFEKFN